MSDYSDILNLERHVSKKHPAMGRRERAAQFSPFAALTGYEALLQEEGRLTAEKRVLTEEEKTEVDKALNAFAATKELFLLEYFKADESKEGGELLSIQTRLEKYDEYSGLLYLEGSLRVPVQNIQSARRLYDR